MITGNIKKCNNRCIFCFIDQLPSGLRDSLYYKDGDYLSSFQYGNFITLTNLERTDIEKIIKYRLEPLNISIHSMDNEIRNDMLRNKEHFRAIDNLKKLDDAGITYNVQIVLCPGINDGEDLKNTLNRFLNQFKNIISIGIVPVGITRFNKCSRLKGLGNILASETINEVDKMNSSVSSKKIFLSDEFYIIGKRDIPPAQDYHGFPQINNGIGKIADFLDNLKIMTTKILGETKDGNISLSSKGIKKCLFLTSEYGVKPLSEALMIIEDMIDDIGLGTPGMDIKVVRNDFLGGNVKVTGLLSGKDIFNSFKSIDLATYDKIFLPDCIFNKDGLTIDDISKKELKAISGKIEIIDEDLCSLIETIYLLEKNES